MKDFDPGLNKSVLTPRERMAMLVKPLSSNLFFCDSVGTSVCPAYL